MCIIVCYHDYNQRALEHLFSFLPQAIYCVLVSAWLHKAPVSSDRRRQSGHGQQSSCCATGCEAGCVSVWLKYNPSNWLHQPELLLLLSERKWMGWESVTGRGSAVSSLEGHHLEEDDPSKASNHITDNNNYQLCVKPKQFNYNPEMNLFHNNTFYLLATFKTLKVALECKTMT